MGVKVSDGIVVGVKGIDVTVFVNTDTCVGGKSVGSETGVTMEQAAKKMKKNRLIHEVKMDCKVFMVLSWKVRIKVMVLE
jgi:hypothetical protein